MTKVALSERNDDSGRANVSSRRCSRHNIIRHISTARTVPDPTRLDASMLRMPLVSLYSHVLNGRMWRSTMEYRDDHDARRLRVRTCTGRDRSTSKKPYSVLREFFLAIVTRRCLR